MKPTLQDVAERAGVSASTASLVLSRKGNISEEVKEKVRKAAGEIGYRKYTAAMSKKAGKIAILFHFDHNLAHTWNMLRQITIALQENLENNRYLTLLIPITYDMTDDTIFNMVAASGSQAVFSMHFGRETLFSRLEEAAIPVVVLINSQFQSTFHTVCADNFQGSCEAASHLIARGHRNILYAEFDIHQLPSTLSDRFLGFYKAINEAGINFNEENRLHLDINDPDDTRRRFEAAFTHRKKPTAIFFIDDYLAAHCTPLLTDLGLSYPKHLSVIAAGEVLDYSEPYIPRITTMRTRPELMGKFAADLVFNILESKQESNQVLKIKQQIVDRGSVAAKPHKQRR
jgi:LacI family transcriptional regulator